MGYLFACLILAFCAIETSGQFMNFLQGYQQNKKFMDEGLEYLRETPSYAFNFAKQFQPSKFNFNQPQRSHQQSQQQSQKRAIPRYNQFDNSLYGGGGLMFNKKFLDEGMEHVRERGTYGQMKSLMSNPSLFLSSLML